MVLEVNEACRICLEHRLMLDWNEEMFEFCGTTYKDCYYKYTELTEESASDEFPAKVCEECADGLKNAYLLFKKAMESFQILEVALKTEDMADTKFSVNEIEEIAMQIHESIDYIISNEISEVDSATDDKSLIEEEIYLLNMCDNISVAETENAINNCKEFTKSEDDAIQPGHFINIQNYESDESSLSQELSESFEAKKKKKSASKNSIRKRKKFNSPPEAFLEEKDSDGIVIKLPKSMAARKTVKIKCGSASPDILLEQKYDDSDLNTSVPSIANKTDKEKKKNLLLCAYCSLQVDGITKLRHHESTHSKNRKRTQICPKCGIKLYTKESLRSHMQTHEENRIKRHKCEFCEKAFFNRGGLNVHRRIHLGLMVKCQICSKEYCRQIDLNRHLLTHSATASDKKVEQKKYTVQCQYCNKHVRTTNWREHKSIHLKEPQVKCKICDKEFFLKKSCVNHLKRVHGKKKGYKDFIHYYFNWSNRMSHLMMIQTEVVQPVTK